MKYQFSVFTINTMKSDQVITLWPHIRDTYYYFSHYFKFFLRVSWGHNECHSPDVYLPGGDKHNSAGHNSAVMATDIVTGAISSYIYISLEIWYRRRMAYHTDYVTYNGLPSKEFFIQNTFKIYSHIMCSNCSEDYRYLVFFHISI